MQLFRALFATLAFAVSGSCFSTAPGCPGGLRSLRMADTSGIRSTRRQLCAAALLMMPMAVSAAPSSISSIQSPVQDIIAPGHWLGQLVGINSHSETWEFDATPEEVSTALVDVLKSLTPQQRSALVMPNFEVVVARSDKVHVLTWTKLEWLDSFDVSLKKMPDGGTQAQATFYATGFFPTSIPLAPLLNVALFWFPFASPSPRGGMLQNLRLKELQSLLEKELS